MGTAADALTACVAALCQDLNTPAVLAQLAAGCKELNDLMHTKQVLLDVRMLMVLSVWPGISGPELAVAGCHCQHACCQRCQRSIDAGAQEQAAT